MFITDFMNLLSWSVFSKFDCSNRTVRSQCIDWNWAIFTVLAAVLLFLGTPQVAFAQTAAQAEPETVDLSSYMDDVIDRVTEFTLDNGMKFIVLERHVAPVISFMTYVDVGAAYEEDSKTGAAHYLEHLAFKGTTRIGTTNYEAEAPLLEQMDELFEQFQAARAAGDEAAIARIQPQFEALKAEAATYVQQNQMGQIVEQAGGVGLNATTSADATRYFYSFPSNKLELWMSLESERFLEPVFREFYEEKDVILEERRMRTDNSPIGKMIEAFLETAFPGHPYGRPIIGYEEDIRNLTREDIQEFLKHTTRPTKSSRLSLEMLTPTRYDDWRKRTLDAIRQETVHLKSRLLPPLKLKPEK